MKRAKLRAMHLLNDMARTESQLRDKLKLGGYPSEITEAAIAYVKSFGYINDDAYIRNFIDSRKDKRADGDLCPSETEGRGYEPGRRDHGRDV